MGMRCPLGRHVNYDRASHPTGIVEYCSVPLFEDAIEEPACRNATADSKHINQTPIHNEYHRNLGRVFFMG